MGRYAKTKGKAAIASPGIDRKRLPFPIPHPIGGVSRSRRRLRLEEGSSTFSGDGCYGEAQDLRGEGAGRRCLLLHRRLRSQLQLGLSIMVVEFPRLPVQSMTAGLFLPAVVRPILDSFETAKQVPQPALSDVVGGVTSKN